MQHAQAPASQRRLREIHALRPHNPDQLHRFVRVVLDLDVPRHTLHQLTDPTPRRDAPFDYLVHAFWEGQWSNPIDQIQHQHQDQHEVQNRDQHTAQDRPADAVVWANRGGGKTLLGAVATLLDLVFKPGIQVRILGGSFEQSRKMHEHLTALLDRPALRDLVAQPPTLRRIELANASAVELLAQSHRSVRGTRVHKLRCDEVDEFRHDVWEAAQLVTRSGHCGPTYVRGSIEALSTMHRPFGMMARLLERHAARVIRWNYLDVIARCPDPRPCPGCVLQPECDGRAKHARGFVAVDDLVAQWRRTSLDTWASEMACRRPRQSDSVYPNFDIDTHVRHAADVPALHRTPGQAVEIRRVGGLDFGLRNPFVLLYAIVASPRNDPFTNPLALTPARTTALAPGITPALTPAITPGTSLAPDPLTDSHLHITHEYHARDLTLDQHLHAIDRRASPQPDPADPNASDAPLPDPRDLDWVAVDPAGHQRNSHTGLSDIQLLKTAGLRPRARRSRLRDGIERIRRRLDRHTLTIDPACRQLIRALTTYHFDPQRPEADDPVKDGPDHAADALRYLVLNLETPGRVERRNY